jgi:hypothetical protein
MSTEAARTASEAYYRASGEDQPARLITAETSQGASVSRSAFGLGVYMASTRAPLTRRHSS